jgi:hypothetical protein
MVTSFFGQNNPSKKNNEIKPKLLFSGIINGITYEKIDSIHGNYEGSQIKLKLSLENKSSIPIIFLRQKTVLETSIWENIKSGGIGDRLDEDSLILESYLLKIEDWRKYKKLINRSKPPKMETYIILPNQKIEFDETCVTDFRNLRNSLPVWLKVKKTTWDKLPIHINNSDKADTNEKPQFYKKLQKRWQKYGYLWLDDIVSEPIPLDLSSAVIKTVTN